MKKFETPILVTRPWLPPLEEFSQGLAEIWKNQWLTNNGPVLERFQAALAQQLGLSTGNLSLFANGTLALELMFQTLGLAGAEVVTTPFTFVATSHALRRIGAIPVFADVDPETLCLSPEAAERMITSRTKAIVPVHVYGHPCDIDGFARLGEKYGLKIVYDAAHSFGVTLDGASIATYGDASMFSFHSTKLFHSIEGGLLTFRDATIQGGLECLRNFAITSETTCDAIGTNAKMNEFAALMGCCGLRQLPDLIAHRKAIYEIYAQAFEGTPVKLLARPTHMARHTVGHNYAYCPVLLPDFEMRERVYARLKAFNVFTRRYFYPLLSAFAPYQDTRGNTPIAKKAADCVLTLPTYHGLALEDVRVIAQNVVELVQC
ncbi:MAG: DegT/DnrJ/EryC1/StrS family aminotransferase [Kiritimatiellia bacterium]